ncbi:hypothetical protein IRJ41_022834 [Triplophysa rosa]|uniref:Uncharacterized protein n=1 Tax=Triplophysa rosa TaxID=992332 RepID=A0A9W8C271_TRIRA|nr:hypothetical protein IRJ41_022834 [Triplophysa rosa]
MRQSRTMEDVWDSRSDRAPRGEMLTLGSCESVKRNVNVVHCDGVRTSEVKAHSRQTARDCDHITARQITAGGREKRCCGIPRTQTEDGL